MSGKSLLPRAAISLVVSGALSCLGLLATPARAAEPLAISQFFHKPMVSSVVASPSGRYVAICATDGTHERLRLLVVDLEDISKPSVLAEFDEEDIVSPLWVNDNRLIFGLGDRNKARGEKAAFGLMTIDREAKAGVKLLIRSNRGDFSRATIVSSGLVLPPSYFLERTLRDGSDDVIVGEYKAERSDEVEYTNLYRLNTLTGRTVKISDDAPDDTKSWIVDMTGHPRVAMAFHDDNDKIYWKATPDAPWTLMRSFRSLDDKGMALAPYGVSPDGFMYATGRMNPKDDTLSLLRFDMSDVKAPPRSVAKIDGYDFDGGLIADTKGTVKGVRYLSDASGTVWLDPELKTIQEEVDKRLTGLSNRIDCGNCSQLSKVLVVSYSDRQPFLVSMYDTAAKKLTVLLKSRPWIDARNMAKQEMDHLKARDGLTIPVLVTHPPGVKGPAPTVVLVHGGPWERGVEWGWSPYAQFLASRGYVVVEPAFRGSTGFGNNLFHAGWKQWGLAMQDDVADATTWAVEKGYSDPKRVCIAGASYGGYATLMGLIRFPDMYRCGFEWVGVSDIDLMYDISWSDSGDTYKKFGMPVLIGDQVKDAAQLALTSPVKRAAEIKQPLLMGYGGYDVRVPIKHGNAMRNALKKTNQNVEWVEYPLEGHGWVRDDSNADWWGRVERFLDKNLKNAP